MLDARTPGTKVMAVSYRVLPFPILLSVPAPSNGLFQDVQALAGAMDTAQGMSVSPSISLFSCLPAVLGGSN